MNKNKYFSFYSVCLIYLLLYMFFNISYVSNGFLIYDDAIFIPKSFFNIAGYPHSPILYFFVDILPKYNVDFLKIFFLLVNSINIVICSFTLSRHIKNNLIAIALGSVIGSVPIAADQIIFVTGSHPILSVFFFCLSLLIFDRIHTLKGMSFVFSNISVLSILFCAALSSPSAFLAPFALPIWLMIAWSFGNTSRPHWQWLSIILFLIFLGVTVYILTGLGKYHYTGLVGWTEFSPSQILQNLFNGAARTATIYGDKNSVVFLLFVAGLFIALNVSIHQWWVDRNQLADSDNLSYRSKELLILGLNALVASALTFGPGSVTTNMIDRYLVAPVTLGLLSVVALTLYFFGRPLTGWRRVAMIGTLLLIVGLNLVRTQQKLDYAFSAHLRTHDAVSDLVRREAQYWPENAQIVLLLTRPGYASPTVGYNHWSTWYLRYMTRNPNILGLLGPMSWVQRDPFVDQYHDHGQEYWEVVDSRSRRIPMIGLETGRPLFVYRQDTTDKFKAFDYVLFNNHYGLSHVAFGHSYKDDTSSQFKKMCGEKQLPDFFRWPGIVKDSSSRAFKRNNLIDSDKNSFDGIEATNLPINLAKNKYFRISFRLLSASKIDSVKYDNTSPPMPMLTPAFAIYQQPSGIRLADRHALQHWDLLPDKEGTIDIFFEGVEGCAVLVGANDRLLGVLGSPSVNGNWLLGRGFLERYWQGTLQNMYLIER